MRFLRSFDGLLCAIFAGIFMVATFLNFLLPVLPITSMTSSMRGSVSVAMRDHCNDVYDPNSPADSSMASVCACALDANQCNDVLIPDVQNFAHWVNPNYFLAWIFLWGFVYQLVLRDSLEVKLDLHAADIATWLCLFLALAGGALSIFQHEKNVDLFALGFFLPQQLVVGTGLLIVWWNIETPQGGGSEKEKFKLVLWSCAQKVAVVPVVGVLLALFQHVSDVESLLYVYHVLLFLVVCDLCYGLASVEAEMDDSNAGKLRLQQSTYLASLVALLGYTLHVFLFMPQADNEIIRRGSLVFAGLLWLQHLLYDAAQTRALKAEHERAFNVSDSMVALMRYSVGAYTLYLCF